MKSFLGRINAFETVTLHTGGMRRATGHEIAVSGSDAEVSLYAVVYRDGKKARRDGTAFTLKAAVNQDKKYTRQVRGTFRGITAISSTGFMKY